MTDDLAPIVPDGNHPAMIRRAFERLNGRITRLRGLFDSTVANYSIVVNGLTVGTLSGLLAASSGTVTVAAAGADYQAPLTFSTGLSEVSNTVSLDTTGFTQETSPGGPELLVMAKNETVSIADVWANGFTVGSAITDASASHTITDPADTPATADALRDDLVANTIPAIETALDKLGTTINLIITALETLGLIAT